MTKPSLSEQLETAAKVMRGEFDQTPIWCVEITTTTGVLLYGMTSKVTARRTLEAISSAMENWSTSERVVGFYHLDGEAVLSVAHVVAARTFLGARSPRQDRDAP